MTDQKIIINSLSEQELKIQKLQLLCINYKKHLDKEIKEHNLDLPQNVDKLWPIHNHSNPQDKLAREKSNVVEKLLNILEGTEEEFLKLNSFNSLFIQKKSLIETRRDSATTDFLKGVLSLITLGLAVLCGIWAVKGKVLARSIDEQINPIPKNLSC